MKIGEVLEKIGDGITKDHIYYWEKICFLKPKLIKKAKIERKEYSEDDLKRIKLIWRFIKEGFSLKASFNKAIAELEREQVNLIYNDPADYAQKSAPRDLFNSYYKILELLQKEFPEANTIVGISNSDLLIAGAVALIAYERKLSNLIPLYVDPDILIEGDIDDGINENSKIVLIADSVGSSNQIIKVVNHLGRKKSEVLGLINTSVFFGEQSMEKLTDKGLKVVTIGNNAHSFNKSLKKPYKSYLEYAKRSLK